MKVINCEQGSEEWFAARLGVPSASNFSKVLAKGSGATRKSYMYELAAEIITGERAESYSNAAMEHGNLYEAEARKAYEFMTDLEVTEVGFIKTDDDSAGASPDGLVGEKGLVEIKCPKTSTHIETIEGGKVPPKHKAQIQGQLWVSEREWCDFISYDPRIKTKNAIFKVRVERDDSYIRSELIPGIAKFNEELKALVQRIGG